MLDKGDIYIYNIYDMEYKIWASHLTCIIFMGLWHENENLNFICHLMDIFIMSMFFTGKMAFDGHDTRQISTLIQSIYFLILLTFDFLMYHLFSFEEEFSYYNEPLKFEKLCNSDIISKVGMIFASYIL